MRDPTEKASPARASRADVCDQIGRTVSSLWQRRTGARPASVSTEYVDDVVRCEIRQGEAPPDVAGGDPGDGTNGMLNSSGYQHGAVTAVERLTGRTVRAFIAKRHNDAPTTNAFILEAVRVRR
jgi:hypothetical protein